MLKTICFFLAAICFLCGALGAKVKFIESWTDLGFFFVTVGVFLL